MSDHMQTIREDLAFMRALAEEGRRAPSLGGAILVAAGVIWAAASLLAWTIASRLLNVPLIWMPGVWLAGLAVFMGALTVLVRANRGKPGHGAVNNRVMRTAWRAAGWSILTFVMAVSVACWRLRDAGPTVMIGPFVLSVYGIGWTVATAFSEQRWVRWVAVACFAGAVGIASLAGSAELFLAYAAVLLLVVALPGWLMLRQEPSTTV